MCGVLFLQKGDVFIVNDFYFNGLSCEDLGVTVVEIGDTKQEHVSYGKQSLATEKVTATDKWTLLNVEYEEPLNGYVILVNRNGEYISSVQQRTLIDWLCFPDTYKEMSLDCIECGRINYNVVFHSPEAVLIGDIIGMKFQIACETPYAYSDVITKEWTTNSFVIDNPSDDKNFLYPQEMIITMDNSIPADSDLTISNDSDDDVDFKLYNLSPSEVITIDNSNRIITSNIASHSILSDFNKKWFRLTKGNQTITKDLACTIELNYRIIRRVGF